MDTRIILRISTLVLLTHGVIELLSMLSIFTGEAPFFIFQELREKLAANSINKHSFWDR